MGEVENLINILSACLTPTVAIMGLFFAWWQHRLACKKRKDDLFDRRWDYYVRAKKEFLKELVAGVENNKAQDGMQKHIKNYIDHYADEALFLFGKDIEKHVRSLPNEIIKRRGKGGIEDPAKSFREPFEKYLGLK